MIQEFPTLYTLNSNKAIRYWKVRAVQEEDGHVYVIKDYGQMDTKKPQINKKQILDTKSKKDLFTQAVLVATSDWNENKNKKGYVTDIDSLSNTVTQLQDQAIMSDNKIESKGKMVIKIKSTEPEEKKVEVGDKKISIKLKSLGESKMVIKIKPIESQLICSPYTHNYNYDKYKTFKFLPMLANKFTEKSHYITYPADGQDKLDGVRCTARKLSSDSTALRSRSDGEYLFFKEIKAAIAGLPFHAGIFLDGEIYCEDHKAIPFKTLNGYANRTKMDGKTGYSKIPVEHINQIKYYVYDCYFVEFPNMSNSDRYAYLELLFKDNSNPFVKLVKKYEIKSADEIEDLHNKLASSGSEGLMIRNKAGVYKLKDRSNDLLKVKKFQDSEFLIVGAHVPTNGKEVDCIIWELSPINDNSIVFNCSPLGKYDERKAEWQLYQADPSKYIGLKYTVRYQETYDNGVPRFPKGIDIRWDL